MTEWESVLAHRRDYWTALLLKHRGKVATACREAGVRRTDVYRTLKKLGIDPAVISRACEPVMQVRWPMQPLGRAAMHLVRRATTPHPSEMR